MESSSRSALSLKARLTLFSIAISVVSLWTLSYFSSQGLRKDAEHVLGEQQLATVSILANQINRELEIRLGALKQVAVLTEPHMTKPKAELQNFLEQRLALLSLFNGSLFITGADGVRIACTPFSSSRIGTDLNDRDYIQAALINGKTTVGKPIIARPYETPVVAMASPVRDASGRIVGALSGVIELSGPSFLDQIPDSYYGKTGGYLLISREHRLIVMATEKARVLSALPEQGTIPALDLLLEGKQASAIFVNSSGVEVLASAKGIPAGDWVLVATLPTDEAFAPLYEMQRFMWHTTILLTLIAGALTWWMTRRQLQPLRNAVRLLQAQSKDSQHFVPLPIEQQDEIGHLVEGFNQVLEALDERDKSLRESEERFRFLHEASFAALMIHESGAILECNQALSELTGYSSEELLGMDRYGLCAPESLSTVLHNMQFDRSNYEVELVRKDGSRVTVNIQGKNIPYKGRIVRATEFRDLTERKLAEKAINQLAFYDQLTGLPNRQLLCDRIGHALATRFRHQREGAVLFVDINQFQRINDTLGREVGDALLQQVSQRLVSCVRDGDTVSRLGSDQFVILLEGLSENQDIAENQTESIAEKILASVHKNFLIENSTVQCFFCIGVAMFDTQSDAQGLLGRAELALSAAKSERSSAVRFFDPQMQASVMEQATLEADLRMALLKEQFLLHYQVQVDSSGHPIGAEVLLRWRHPERGFVSPAEFITMAEDTGLIIPMGQWVLESACRQIAAWARQPQMAHLSVAVNVSARQFHHTGFVKQVLDVLEKTHANPQRLKLELTEGLLLNDVEIVVAKMSNLKEKGISFSLDDFGTGYSSLSYLKRLPLDQLKIDQSFVRDVLSNPDDAAITRAIITLGRNLELEVIAEGVETESQRDFLARNGCLIYQGYHFGRPLAVEAFEQLILHDWVSMPIHAYLRDLFDTQ